MINWLFGQSFFQITLLIIAIIIVVLLCAKTTWGKYFFGVIGFFVLTGLTVFCGVKVNTYYSASGGIFGTIKSVFVKPKVEMTQTIKSVDFEFSNISMSKLYDDDENTYAVTLISDETYKLESGKTYQVYVNDIPVLSNFEEDYLTATFYYVFYGSDYSAKFEDDLKLDFAFYNNFTSITLTTDGGQKAYAYWLKYFSKENFVVKVSEIDSDNLYSAKSSIDNDIQENLTYIVRFSSNIPYQDDNSNFFGLPFYRVLAGKTVSTPSEIPTRKNYNFVGWSLDGENPVEVESVVINSDTIFLALWQSNEISVNFHLNGCSLGFEGGTISEDMELSFAYDDIINFSDVIIDPKYEFLYYSFGFSGKIYSSVVDETFNHSIKSFYDNLIKSDDMSERPLPPELEQFVSNEKSFKEIESFDIYVCIIPKIEDISDIEKFNENELKCMIFYKNDFLSTWSGAFSEFSDDCDFLNVLNNNMTGNDIDDVESLKHSLFDVFEIPSEVSEKYFDEDNTYLGFYKIICEKIIFGGKQ